MGAILNAFFDWFTDRLAECWVNAVTRATRILSDGEVDV
jgi:hypothetical protein